MNQKRRCKIEELKLITHGEPHKMPLSQTPTENAMLVFQYEKARNTLSELLNNNIHDKELKPEIEQVITKMFAHNPKLEPDSLIRAAFFVVKSNRNNITPSDVTMIAHDGGKDNYSWPALVPVIRTLLAKEK
jgi:hypothetical protein